MYAYKVALKKTKKKTIHYIVLNTCLLHY